MSAAAVVSPHVRQERNPTHKLRRPLPHQMHQATLTQSIVDKHSIDWSPGWLSPRMAITTSLTRPLAQKVIEFWAARQCPPLPALCHPDFGQQSYRLPESHAVGLRLLQCLCAGVSRLGAVVTHTFLAFPD